MQQQKSKSILFLKFSHVCYAFVALNFYVDFDVHVHVHVHVHVVNLMFLLMLMLQLPNADADHRVDGGSLDGLHALHRRVGGR